MSKQNTQGLKTLGDYRRAAKELLYGILQTTLAPPEKEGLAPLPVTKPKKESGSPYDAITTALEHSRELIHYSRNRISDRDEWGAISFLKTKYEMTNFHPTFRTSRMQ